MEPSRRTDLRLTACFAAALAVVLFGVDADAARRRATVQWVFGGSDEPSVANTTRYYAPYGQGVLDPGTQRGTRRQVWTAGTIRHLFCRVAHDGANDLGDTGTLATVTLLVNGVATALSGTIRGGPGFERDCLPAPDEDVVTVAEGDTLEMQYTVVGAVHPNGRVAWAFEFRPAEPDHFVMPSGFVWPSPVPTYPRAFGYSDYVFGTPEAATRFVSPIEGRFTKLLCKQSPPQTAGTHTYSLTREGVATALACRITAGSDHAAVDAPVPVSAGDSFGFLGSGSNPSSPVAGTTMATLVFVPAVSGHYFLAGTGNAGWSSSGVRFQTFDGPRAACTTERTANATPLAGFDGTSGEPLVEIEGMLARITTRPQGGQGFRIELVEQPTTDDTIPPTTPRGPACVIDALCPAPPCFCTSSTPHTPLWDGAGPSWYEFRITPYGLPAAPYAQLSLHVARANEADAAAVAARAQSSPSQGQERPLVFHRHRGIDRPCE